MCDRGDVGAQSCGEGQEGVAEFERWGKDVVVVVGEGGGVEFAEGEGLRVQDVLDVGDLEEEREGFGGCLGGGLAGDVLDGPGEVVG